MNRNKNTINLNSTMDALGRRIRNLDTLTNTTTLYYYSDNWQVLAEYNGTGTLQAYYVYGNYIDETLLMWRNSADKYYLHDHLFSPVALTDSSGTVQERYEYDAYGTIRFLSPNYEQRTTSSYGNCVAFTGREIDNFDFNAGTPRLTKMHYRHRDYSPFMGRFYQEDKLGMMPENPMGSPSFDPTIQYGDSLSPYLAFRALPTQNNDPYGLWGTIVHKTATSMWARIIGYPRNAAQAIGDADEAVDSKGGGKSPYPGIGEQSYHFNRNRFGGTDSRMEHYTQHCSEAEVLCRPDKDIPEKAAEQLGTALHPYQDIDAHGDFGLRNISIVGWHNLMSPQTDLWATHGIPGNYPDDIRLDTVGPIQYITIKTPPGPGLPPVTTTYDYYRYTPGNNRYQATRMKTIEALKEYRWYIQSKGGCKCRKYFLGVE